MLRYYITALVIILFDQASKWLVVKKMDLYESIPIIDGFFRLTSHRNKGAAWGILQDQMMFFYIITLAVVIGIIYYMQKYAKNTPNQAFALSLILGGAIGNFIDRLLRKEVVDFLDVTLIKYEYPIFNIADSALFIGVICILIITFKEERKVKKGTN